MQNKKCKYGFYTCSFIGQVDFCNSCDEGQNYQMKEARGGKRIGSGRKKADYETKTIAFRVRVEFVEPIKKLVKDYVSERLQGDA
jgi:hypothetical protein